MPSARPGTAEVETPPGGRDLGTLALLACACGLALVRLLWLGEWGLWIDEAYTWVDLNHGLDSGQLFNPHGYRLIGGMIELLGGRPDEVSLRLLPAMAGIACVPLTAWAFQPAVGGRRAAWAALFLAASSWHVFWSQSARFYTLAQALSLIGTGLLLRGLYGDARARRELVMLVLGVLLAGLAAIFHPTAAFLLPGVVLGTWLALGLCADRPASLRRGGYVLLGFAALGLVVLGLKGAEALGHHARQKPAAGALSGVLHLANTIGFFFTPWWLVGAAVGTLDALRRRESGALLVAGGAVTSVIVAALIATRAQMTAQYVFVALPWVAVLASVPLRERVGSARLVSLGYAALILLPTLASTGLYFGLRGGERAPWREAYEYVAEHRGSGEMVLGMGSAVGEFYLGGDVSALRRPELVCDLAEWFPDGPRRWARHDRRIWVVVRPQWTEGFRPEDQRTLERWLAQDCRLVRRFAGDMEGRDLDVLVYVRD